MGFSQSTITQVFPPVQSGSQLLLSWASTSPAGTFYQVYAADALLWYGTTLFTSIPLPTSVVRITIGTVDAADRTTNFSATFGYPATRADLSWFGGSFEGADIAGFFVYGEATPGGGVNFVTPLATVTAYPGSIFTDGWNFGPWNVGGWGEDASAYTWTSAPLSSGLWTFAVSAFDTAGNIGTTATTTVMIEAPPIEVAPFSDRTRLHYSFNPTSEIATLTWNASPSA